MRAGVLLSVFVLWLGLSLPASAQEPTAHASSAQDRFSDRVIGAGRANAPASAGQVEGPSVTRIAVSLGVVVVLICGLGWTYRRLFTVRQQKAGGGVSLVSRSILTPRHQVLILRTGHRLLIVGDSGQGMNLLADVSDPGEISAILGEAAGASAFSDALEGASETYEANPPDSEPLDQPPAGAVQNEVRSLIDRVRALAGETRTTTGHTS